MKNEQKREAEMICLLRFHYENVAVVYEFVFVMNDN